MSVWYHPLFNDAIVTMNPRYIIPLNEVVCWVLGVGCWVLTLFRMNPLKHLYTKLPKGRGIITCWKGLALPPT